MSRYNTPAAKALVRSPVTSEAVPSGRTYEGAPGYARPAQSELFLLAIAYMGSDAAFYETGKQRDDRFAGLVRQVAVEDPAWMKGFVPWLRNTANMRTASLVAAAEAARALLDVKLPGGRAIVSAALQRADEPGEMLAYWHSRYGRNEPKPLKRGIADAVVRLYSEFSLLRYDTDSHGYRFGDVIERVHPGGPKVAGTWRGALYEHAIDRRHGRDNPVPGELRMVGANAILRVRAARDPSVLLNAAVLQDAGFTWEDALSLAGNRVDKARLWEALIPGMGFMAQLRNLRGFDEAGVTDEVAGDVIARLTDPEQVARSRQFPFRFLAAYRAAPSLRWAYPLERALSLSLANVPVLKGRTLVLVDRSMSMWDAKMSTHSDMDWADAAAVFGAAVALRAERADLVEFSSRPAVMQFSPAESVLRVIERFHKGDSQNGPVGTGTDIPRAVRDYLRPDHTRVVIVTDEQSEPGMLPSNVWGRYGDAMPPTRIDDLIPQTVPVCIWNIGGYKHGVVPSGTGNRHLFGGLTDASFRLIPLLEAGRNARWDDLFRPAPADGTPG
jgi:TROVE domain